MATNIYSTNSHGNLICGSSTIGTTIYSNGSSNIAYNYDLVDRNEKLNDFIEFGIQLMGIDLSFEDFSNMTESDKKAFMRNHRLDNLLKNKGE
jgi:hypothetical protein